MNKLIFLFIFLFALSCTTKKDNKIEYPEFKIGVIADCQYCNCEPTDIRFYKESPARLQQAVDILNRQSLDYTVHLGDFIDKDFSSFDTIVPIWRSLKSENYHVLGNHDFSVADSLKPLVFEKMDIEDRYYSMVKNKWRFIVLDGNDLSMHGALTASKKQQTDSLFNLLADKSMPNIAPWNGGMSIAQLQWVEGELQQATENKERVGFYCHFPVLGISDRHNLWNYNQLLDIIDKYDCVKFYFNGHNHAGGYVEKNGVHYLNFKGMVDTKDTSSFATVTFQHDSLKVKGYGRELDRSLKIK